MNHDELYKLSQDALTDYVWKRLRQESPMDPMLAGTWGGEDPEQFLVQAVKQSNDSIIRDKLSVAIHENINRLLDLPKATCDNNILDDHVASIAFLIYELDMLEFIQPLIELSQKYSYISYDDRLTMGKFHMIKTVAHLKEIVLKDRVKELEVQLKASKTRIKTKNKRLKDIANIILEAYGGTGSSSGVPGSVHEEVGHFGIRKIYTLATVKK